MGILDEDIARVRDATDIVAVITAHTQLRKVGQRWTGLCPFHNEKSPSFSVNQVDGLYYCFGCRASGDVITFVREIEHLDFAGAVEWLAGKAGITLRYTDRQEGESRKRLGRLRDAMTSAVDWYHDRLLHAPDAGQARGYLRSRGFDREMVEQYRLGWAPDGWDEMVKALRLPREVVVDTGLGLVNRAGRLQDFFRARVLFPIFDDQGNAVAFGGRKLPGAEGAKYQNSREGPLYNKSRTLYGLNWAKADVVASNEMVVCEGYTDVIGFFTAGVPRAVATCGTALTEDHIRHITRYTRRIVLAYDADEAGQTAAERVYEWEQRHDVSVSVLALPPGADPDELSRSDPAALREAVSAAKPFLGFRVDRVLAAADLSSPEGRAHAAEAALDMVREHPNELVRDQYLMQIADTCRVEPARLREELARPASRAPAEATPRRRRGDRDDPGPTDPGGGYPGGAEVRDDPELEAVRLLVHRPEEMGPRLHPVLFSDRPAGRAYRALREAPDLPTAIDDAEPVVSDLLARVAVEEPRSEVNDVAVRVLDRAASRALGALEREARHAEDPFLYQPAMMYLKLTLDELRGDDPAMETAPKLLAWLVQHDEDLA